MKQITIDYKLYQQELTDAAMDGAKVTVELIDSIDDCLSHLSGYSTQEKFYKAKQELQVILKNLKSYGKKK